MRPHRRDTITQFKGQYFAAVEGVIPLAYGGIHPPDLRHSAATLLLQGVPAKVVSEMLRDALRRLEARVEPGSIWELDYPEYAPDPAIRNNGEILHD